LQWWGESAKIASWTKSEDWTKMLKHPLATPARKGDTEVLACPLCGSECIGREQELTKKLYFGCKNYPTCKFNGCRDFNPDQMKQLEGALGVISAAIGKKGYFAVSARK
jgi:ssDNA-binding Zn-finger/Zn-ribbon topoisomerase 1